MTELVADPWRRCAEPQTPPVPVRYRGVWRRTLLQTPTEVDRDSWVRWLQLGRWHADLRVPATAQRVQELQGFAGVTEVRAGAQGEICTWHRMVDFQPPGPHPDAGYMSFETEQRLVEVGVHGEYREVWERLPGSLGRGLVAAELPRPDGLPAARLFLAGRYLMRVRPASAHGHLDFEISFGVLAAGRWRIERSTLPQLQGQSLMLRLQRTGLEQLLVALQGQPARTWRLLEWDD